MMNLNGFTQTEAAVRRLEEYCRALLTPDAPADLLDVKIRVLTANQMPSSDSHRRFIETPVAPKSDLGHRDEARASGRAAAISEVVILPSDGAYPPAWPTVSEPAGTSIGELNPGDTIAALFYVRAFGRIAKKFLQIFH